MPNAKHQQGTDSISRRGPRKGDRFDNKLAAIIQTGAMIFTEQGYESTSLDDIAKKLKMHKTTLYHYVENKEKILLTIFQITLEDLSESIKQVEHGTEPAIERLRLFFKSLIQVQRTDLGKCLCLISPQPLSKKSAQEIKTKMRWLDKAVADLVREGIADGSIVPCDPRLASAMLFGAFNWVARWYQPNGKYSLAGIGEAFLNLFVDGMAPRVCSDSAATREPKKG